MKFELNITISAETNEEMNKWLKHVIDTIWIEEKLYDIGRENDIEFTVKENDKKNIKS